MAELDDWTCEFNGLRMGMPDSAISIVAVDGLLTLPEIRSSDLTLVQRHGLYAGDDYMNGRTITLTLEVYGRDRAEFTSSLIALQNAFMPGEDEQVFSFRFPGAAADRTAFVMARPRKRSAPLDLNFANLVCLVVVELYATQPYITGVTDRVETVRSYRRATVDGGLAFPATVPFHIVSPSAPPPDPVTWLYQYGSVTARPVIDVTDAVDATLVNDTTGRTFGMAYTGSYTIDSAAQRVTTNQGDDITALVVNGSYWPEYTPGGHRLRLVHGDPLTEAIAVATWRDRWV